MQKLHVYMCVAGGRFRDALYIMQKLHVCVWRVAGFGMARYVEEGFPAGLHPILPVKWTAPEVMQ